MEYHLETPGTQQNHSQPLRAKLTIGVSCALHCVLQAHTRDKSVLICPHFLLVVDSIHGKAQKCCRHKWTGLFGPVSHVDLSIDMVALIESAEAPVH